MIERARNFIVANVIAILGTVLAVSLAVNAWLLVKVYGFKVGPIGFEGLQAKADKADLEVKFARETARVSEALREQEQAQGSQSFNSANARCDQRVSTASKAARIISKVTYVQENAPVSAGADSIIHASELRGIIGQDAEPEAASLPAGTDSTASQ